MTNNSTTTTNGRKMSQWILVSIIYTVQVTMNGGVRRKWMKRISIGPKYHKSENQFDLIYTFSLFGDLNKRLKRWYGDFTMPLKEYKEMRMPPTEHPVMSGTFWRDGRNRLNNQEKKHPLNSHHFWPPFVVSCRLPWVGSKRDDRSVIRENTNTP